MKREDFTFEADSYGYMIKYKGQNIGGAGVLGRPKQHWRHARSNRRDNAQHAHDAINALVNGQGESRFLAVIKTIDD
jgi:hypothetical protein